MPLPVNTSRCIRPFTKSLFLSALVLLSAARCFGMDGIFVPVGQSHPKRDFLYVTGGQPTELDLLTKTPLPGDNRCHLTLYLLGGSQGVKVSERTTHLATSSDGDTGYRTSLSIDIPSARPGSRFLLKAECVSPVTQSLGEIEFHLRDFEPVDQIRADLNGRTVHLAGRSLKLRELLTRLKIAFADDSNYSSDALILTEEAGALPPAPGPVAVILVEFASTPDEIPTLVAQKNETGWRVQVCLPDLYNLSGPQAPEVLAKTIRFALKLETPS